MSTKAKILFVGPSECGKSTICNYLSENSDLLDNEYIPTIACRILEIEQEFKLNNRLVKNDVELWDCSGDYSKYQQCLPAILDDSSGIVFVINTLNNNKQLESINLWYTSLVDNLNIKDEQCLLIVHNNPNLINTNNENNNNKLSNLFKNVQKINSNLEDEGDKLKDEFKKYLFKIISLLIKKRDQEEQKLLR